MSRSIRINHHSYFFKKIEEYVKLAYGLLSTYLEPELAEELQEHLGIKNESEAGSKRSASTEVASENKRRRRPGGDGGGPTEDYSGAVQPVAASATPVGAKQRALAKSAAGSKNIASFFKKK